MMRNTRNLYWICSVGIFIFLIPLLGYSQQSPPEVREDFTDEELQSFAEAYQEVMMVQQESEKKMVQAIEKEDLTLDRFNEMLTMQQDPEMELNASAEEMAAFNKAAQAIIKEKEKNESRLVSIIEGKGLNISIYEDIVLAYQHSPVVQQKLDKILQENTSVQD